MPDSEELDSLRAFTDVDSGCCDGPDNWILPKARASVSCSSLLAVFGSRRGLASALVVVDVDVSTGPRFEEIVAAEDSCRRLLRVKRFKRSCRGTDGGAGESS